MPGPEAHLIPKEHTLLGRTCTQTLSRCSPDLAGGSVNPGRPPGPTSRRSCGRQSFKLPIRTWKPMAAFWGCASKGCQGPGPPHCIPQLSVEEHVLIKIPDPFLLFLPSFCVLLVVVFQFWDFFPPQGVHVLQLLGFSLFVSIFFLCS